MSLAISPKLAALWQRGSDFLGCPVPIMGGAMTWVSERHLVSALSNAGAFGVLATGSMPPAMLKAEIEATQAMTNKPFGVNLIVMHPQLMELIDVIIETRVTHVVLAGGLPPAAAVTRLKEVGVKIIALPTTLALAKKFIRQGIDALILEGMEAGGHIGPVTLTVLAQEILPHITDVPIFVAGGLGRGEAIAAYLEMGAAGAQLGTRFVVATECRAHANFKKAFLHANARDAVPSIQVDPRFPVIPVRALANDAGLAFAAKQRDVIAAYDAGTLDLKAAQLEIEHFWAGALRRAAVEGDIDNGSVMAGQSVAFATAEAPITTILAELVAQAEAALAKRAA